MGERCELHEMTMEQLKTYQLNQVELVKNITDLRERITRVEESTASAHHRIDSQEEQTKAIYELAYEVKAYGKQQEQIIIQQGEMLEMMKGHGGRLDKLERAPGDSLLAYWKIFIGAILTGGGGIVVGYLANKP